MKKAVINTGGKQYLVSEGEIINVEFLKDSKKSLGFKPLLVIDEDKVLIGKPSLEGNEVTAEVVEPLVKLEKMAAIRYKAKKRVHKVKGQRQKATSLKIVKIV